MGISVIIHGFIDCPFDFGRRAESRRIFDHNKSVIASLPTKDDDYPALDRSMFAVHPPKGIEPYYDAHLITFGAAYKNMYHFESDWLRKFEQLLARLCWYEASVINEFGALRCNWRAEQAHERAFADPPLPPLKWSMTCFRLFEQEIPIQDAVDESYPPRAAVSNRPGE